MCYVLCDKNLNRLLENIFKQPVRTQINFQFLISNFQTIFQCLNLKNT